MANHIYALLVGINDYPNHVGRLYGCLNDVQHLHEYLSDNCDRSRLHVETLLNSDATRRNVIDQIRTHLGKAGKDDVVVFHYSGHGARSKSASQFRQFFPDGWDEGLVCHDSRDPSGFDLADKELAVLLAEVARNDPHLAVIFDCCHSGSATRNADDFTQLKARQTHQVLDERPLESYLDGYYAKVHNQGEPLQIPASRHILLAACQRVQKAWEGKDHNGVFTSTLLEVLGKSGPDISYADLFVRCRAAVRKRADNQDPQFETYCGFPAYAGFLGNPLSHAARRFSVYFEDRSWRVDCGALHGLPSDPDKTVELALFPESDQSRVAGHAATTQVGAQKSDLQLLDFEPDPATRFQAEITTLPVPPLAVYLEGDAQGRESFEKFLTASGDRSLGVSLLTDAPEAARYTLCAENGSYLLKFRETDLLIQGAKGYTQQAAEYMFAILNQVAAWERAVVLQNRSTRMNPDEVPFQFCELLGNYDNAEPYVYPNSEITLDIRKENGEWQVICGTLKARNLTQQPLHILLVHFADDYGIQVLYNERIEPTDLDFTVTLDGKATFYLSLDDNEGDEAIHTFKLIVSTENVDEFLLGQKPLEIGRIFEPRAMMSTKGLTPGPPRKKLVHENEWFTKDLHVKLVRQLDRVTTRDTTLAGGKITIKGHPSLQAGVSLSAAKTTTRSLGTAPDFYRAIERAGMELLNFSGTRGDESILELTDIQNPAALEQDPLEIELDVRLAAGEFILPLAFDGEHLLLTGDPWQDEQRRTHVRIDHIPDISDNRRSLGRALKLYFFKTYLGQENVNRLCWIEYKPDGTFERHCSDVVEKVAAAKNVLLLIHGIIGNTDGIVQGLKLATDADGQSVDQKFDLVLTYDYENLNTPIAETAVKLKQQLAESGLHEDDDKRLTLLVHSMGGLVARWFIEREGGDRMVDHLVMTGTPNNGSPIGMVNMARRLSSMLTTLAINAFPAYAPFGAALLSALGRSQKLTPTLEQMSPDSDFIRLLNASDDPAVLYTIVAGDIRDFREESGDLMQQLIAKIGGGVLFSTLFQGGAHDIAVADTSIRYIPDTRTPLPLKIGASCHHLNYFVSEAGIKVMSEVQW